MPHSAHHYGTTSFRCRTRRSALSTTALRDAATARVRGEDALAPSCVAALRRLLPGPRVPVPPAHGGRRPNSRSVRGRARNTRVSRRRRKQGNRKPWEPSRSATSHRTTRNGCIDIRRWPSAASGFRWTPANPAMLWRARTGRCHSMIPNFKDSSRNSACQVRESIRKALIGFRPLGGCDDFAPLCRLTSSHMRQLLVGRGRRAGRLLRTARPRAPGEQRPSSDKPSSRSDKIGRRRLRTGPRRSAGGGPHGRVRPQGRHTPAPSVRITSARQQGSAPPYGSSAAWTLSPGLLT